MNIIYILEDIMTISDEHNTIFKALIICKDLRIINAFAKIFVFESFLGLEF